MMVEFDTFARRLYVNPCPTRTGGSCFDTLACRLRHTARVVSASKIQHALCVNARRETTRTAC